MIVSSDKEMRLLGRAALSNLPKTVDMWGKIALYLNSGIYTQLGKNIFFREKKTLKNYDKLLSTLEDFGYTEYAWNALVDIERVLKNTKKLTELLKEDTRLTEFRKRVGPISTRSSWFDDFDH